VHKLLTPPAKHHGHRQEEIPLGRPNRGWSHRRKEEPKKIERTPKGDAIMQVLAQAEFRSSGGWPRPMSGSAYAGCFSLVLAVDFRILDHSADYIKPTTWLDTILTT
jgi:hypothetical protein